MYSDGATLETVEKACISIHKHLDKKIEEKPRRRKSKRIPGLELEEEDEEDEEETIGEGGIVALSRDYPNFNKGLLMFFKNILCREIAGGETGENQRVVAARTEGR